MTAILVLRKLIEIFPVTFEHSDRKLRVTSDIFNLLKVNKFKIEKFNNHIEEEFASKAVMSTKKREKYTNETISYKNIKFKTAEQNVTSFYKILLNLS